MKAKSKEKREVHLTTMLLVLWESVLHTRGMWATERKKETGKTLKTLKKVLFAFEFKNPAHIIIYWCHERKVDEVEFIYLFLLKKSGINCIQLQNI